MALDLLVKNATLVDGTKDVDIACSGEKIVSVRPNIMDEAITVIDAKGMLVSPPFVDSHFHLDAAMSFGRPRINTSGTLLEGTRLWGELRGIQTVDEVIDRAMAYCDMAISQGILAIRSHVDVCDDALIATKALIEVRKKVAPYLDLELVAFPVSGFYRAENTEKNLLRALDMGVDIVGGIPHYERTMAEGARSVTRLCEIAAERGLKVDLHCDESDDPNSRHIEILAYETQRLGLQGRTTGSHLTSMHSMDNYYVSKLIDLMVEAGVSAIANPLINMMLQGRHDGYPKRRGLTRVKELRAAGIAVAFGSDDMMDPWYPLGAGDMLEVAAMGLHANHFSSMDDMHWCYKAITDIPAQIMGLENYGLSVGCNADMVILQAKNTIEAIRLKPTRLNVIRRGKVISQSNPNIANITMNGRPNKVDLLGG